MTLTIRENVLIVLATILVLNACSEKHFASPPDSQMMRAVAPETAARSGQAGAISAPRYRALRHFMTVEVAADAIEAQWKATQDLCIVKMAAQCELLESNLMRPEGGRPASASLKIRIAPAQSDALRATAIEGSTVVEDRTESTDKTDAVLDTEARLRNTIALRDRLRGMLTARDAKLKDLMDLERELARVQSDIDSFTEQRKALANETEKTFFQFEFRARRSIAEFGTFSPVTRALTDVTSIFAESVAALVRVAAALVPWLLVIGIGLWILMKLWRRVRSRRKSPAANV